MFDHSTSRPSIPRVPLRAPERIACFNKPGTSLITAVVLLCTAGAAAEPNFALKPISSTGPYTIVNGGSEIVIPGTGVEITLEIIASGWSTVPPAPPRKLGACQATIADADFASGPGTPLEPKGGFLHLDSAYQVLSICQLSLRNCSSGELPCAEPEGFCVPNPRFIFPGLFQPTPFPPNFNEYVFSAVSAAPGQGAVEPNGGYLGTLVLTVPAGAVGTYAIGFKDDPQKTFMSDQDANAVQGLTTTPGKITIPVGRCCHGVGTLSPGCVDDVTLVECEGMSPASFFDSSGLTCADPCCNCEMDAECYEIPENNCTADTCAFSCRCVHTPVYDEDTECCDPTLGSDGGITLLSDANSCTTDICDAGSGLVSHIPISGILCDDGDPCTANDRCIAGACAGIEVSSIPCFHDADCPIGGCNLETIRCSCHDLCPEDPLKLNPGACGCGIPDDLTDGDADGTLDCLDVCPGLDDALYAPGCGTAIPAASTWGIAVLILTLLAGAKVRAGRMRAATAVVLLSATGALAEPNFALKPISSTGPYTIVNGGSEIVIPGTGVEITLEIIASGWSTVPPAPPRELGAFFVTTDHTSYASGGGVPLELKGGIFSSEGAYQTRQVCQHSQRSCNSGQPPCDHDQEGFCTGNPRWIFNDCGEALIEIPYFDLDLDLEYEGFCGLPGVGTSEPHPGYCGTFILIVPPGAHGTYTIGFRDHPDETWMADQYASAVDGLTTTPGKISIAAGACCRTDGECMDWTQDSCEADGGTFFDGQPCAALTPCCMEDATCRMLDARCCTLQGGVPMPDAPACDDDADGDGLDAGCGDACPGNPEKVALGPCGCENSELLDSDLDGIDDCADQCPGLDDALYAPGCGTAIPAASTWGITVMILTLLAGAKARAGRRHQAPGA